MRYFTREELDIMLQVAKTILDIGRVKELFKKQNRNCVLLWALQVYLENKSVKIILIH